MKDVWEDLWVWAALLVLLALTFAVSFTDWGPWKTVASFLISAMKAALVAYFYMHLKRDKGMTRIFAMAGIAWLAILFALTLSDYISRGWLPYPSRWPVMVKLRAGEIESLGPQGGAPPQPGK